MSGVRTPTAAAVILLTGAIFTFGDANSALGQQNPGGSPGWLPTAAFAETRPEMSGVRFFTINEVLRLRDAPRSGSGRPATIRIASIDVAKLRGTLTDVQTAAYAAAPKAGPFGMSNFRAPEGLLWVKWRKLEAELRHDDKIIAQCRSQPDRCPAPEARRVSSIIEAVEARNGRAKLEEANRSVNGSIRYTSDLAQHGVPDLWSAALATFSQGRGDCEDYAIAKYAILRAAGVPAEDLRIMLVRDLSAGEAHAVLAAHVDGKWLVLDNRRAEISEDRAIGHFAPLFALDHQGVSLLAQSYATVSQAQKMWSADATAPSESDPPLAAPASGPLLE